MKPKPTLRHFLAAIGCATFAISSASAQTDGTWEQPDSGTYDWSDTDNWLDNIVAGGTGSTASFTVDASGAQTVNLDTAVTLGNLTLDRNQNLTIDGPEVLTLDVSSDTPILDVNSGRILNMNAVLAGSDGLQKNGAGTLTLNGTAVHTFTGGLNLNGGTLALNFTNLAIPTDLVNSGNPLALGGGILSVTGNSSGTTDQTLGNVTLNPGGSRILGNTNGGDALNITLGSLTANADGGSLIVGGTASNLPVITTTTDKNASGTYGGRVVYFDGTANTGYDWATTADAAAPFALSAYVDYAVMASSGSNSLNSRITAGHTLDGDLTTNSLKFENPATQQILDLGGNTLTLSSGGLLFTGNAVGQGPRINNGNLTAGADSNYDLVIHQYQANNNGGGGINNNTHIFAAITNNGENEVSLVKAGTGTLILSGANAFTGGIVVNDGGTLGWRTNGTAAVNNNSLTFNANTIVLAGNPATTNGGITINKGSQIEFRNNTQTFTVNGAVTGEGGGITLGQDGGGATRLVFNSTDNTFNGPIRYAVTAGGGQAGHLTVNSLADSTTLGEGNLSFGVAGTNTNEHIFTYGADAVAPLTLDNRRIELAGGHSTPVLENNSTQAFTINTDLLPSGTGTKNFTLRGTGAGLSTFAGDITNGTISTLNLVKNGTGTWALSGDNTYNGTTTVTAGTLLINGDQSAAAGAVAVNGTSTLGGSGTLGGSVTVAAGANLSPGASVGTLGIGGDLNISAMAGGSGQLLYELGSIAASDQISVSGALDIGEGLLGFGDFDFTNLGGLEDGVYTLISSNALSGTLDGADLSGTIGTFDATLQINGNDIELALAGPPPSTTLVIDLQAGTEIPGGAFGTFDALNLPIPPLPAGSILRSVEVNAVLEDTDNENFASDLAVLFDPTPETPGDDFSVVITNGTIKFGAPVQLGWAGGDAGPPAPLEDTKLQADWAAAGTIDLATTGIFLGNSFNNDLEEPTQGGTWSGTITLTYDDMDPTGSPFELWAGPGVTFDGDESGDEVSNGLAFLLGAASPDDSALDLLPVANEDAGGLVLTFSMLESAARGSASLAIEHSSDLGIADAWTTVPVPGTSGGPTNGVTFAVTPGSPLNSVTATISPSESANGKLFGRLKATE